ncbi:dTDP-4-dehydrorhamnose reductase [Evansella caseinilytica]|uniref:dTDP-4-dehydrorhamnose reductase n=1 Tax=Evansella caseinilytica TaxID=1503961 RepID=A0A1H3HNF4_9BACI|nr:dTDP-4-dehydrorhamnose reductase [Evansella caseinilytica]SDY17056.1 dTDP-4-dehydrorhamnose reductase [Evansella caseinilytica]
MLENTESPILITGKSGQLSTALQAGCAARGLPYIALGRKEMDITNKVKVEATVRSIAPAVILHTAALTDVDGAEREPERCVDINVRGTQHLLEAAAAVKASFLYISSDYVFRGDGQLPLAVDAAPSPVNQYGFTKWLGEEAVKAYPYPWWIVRTSWLFGGKGKHFARTIAEQALKERKISVVDDQCGAPTYVTDLAETIFFILDKSPGIYHAANRGHCSRWEWAQYIYWRVGREPSHVDRINSRQRKQEAKRPAYSVLDLSKLVESSIPQLRDWQAAVDDYLALEGWLDD